MIWQGRRGCLVDLDQPHLAEDDLSSARMLHWQELTWRSNQRQSAGWYHASSLSHLLCGISCCYTFVKLMLSPGVIQTKLLTGWFSNSNTRYKSISWLWQYSMYSSWEVWNGCQHGLAELRSQCPFLWTGPLSNCTLISCLRLEPTSSRSAAPYTFFVRHQFLGIKGRKVALQAAVVGSFITKWVWLRSIVVHSHIYMYI